MLPASHRLRRSADFRSTTRSGLRAGRAALVVHVATAPATATAIGPDQARVGFTVGRSVGNSVTRHRVSRRLREAMRPLVADLPPGSRIVIRALPQAATASVADLREQIASALASVQRRAS